MTVGELARMFNDELKIGADLVVVPIEGWRRADHFDATGLLWINPSPNMRNLMRGCSIRELACWRRPIFRSGAGPIRRSKSSALRGSTACAWPVSSIARPGGSALHSDVFTRRRANSKTSGAAACRSPSPIAGASCRYASGSKSRGKLRALFPEVWGVADYDRLLGSAAVLKAVTEGTTVSDIELLYQTELESFLKRRARFLLYKP